MNLRNLTDALLIQKTETLAREERERLTSVLHHLREIERRRPFSEMGYNSIHDFAIRHLRYSEDQAARRVAAMRLLIEIPEIEIKIKDGDLLLSHIGLAQNFFNQEMKASERAFTKSEKLDLLESIENKPIREAQKITFSLSSVLAPMKPDHIKLISEDRLEMRFQASAELQNKIEKLKDFLAHKEKNMSLGELFEKLCDLGLAHWNPEKPKKKDLKRDQPKGGDFKFGS